MAKKTFGKAWAEMLRDTMQRNGGNGEKLFSLRREGRKSDDRRNDKAYSDDTPWLRRYKARYHAIPIGNFGTGQTPKHVRPGI